MNGGWGATGGRGQDGANGFSLATYGVVATSPYTFVNVTILNMPACTNSEVTLQKSANIPVIPSQFGAAFENDLNPTTSSYPHQEQSD